MPSHLCKQITRISLCFVFGGRSLNKQSINGRRDVFYTTLETLYVLWPLVIPSSILVAFYFICRRSVPDHWPYRVTSDWLTAKYAAPSHKLNNKRNATILTYVFVMHIMSSPNFYYTALRSDMRCLDQVE